MSQANVYISIILAIFFATLLPSQTANGQALCNGTAIATRGKYDLLTINMTEAQVATVMGGTGAEQFQIAIGSMVQKSVQFIGPTVNYLSQGLILITFSNGQLTSKSISGLCPTPTGQCSSVAIATRAKYNLLTMNMTEAQVVTAMGGAGIEQSSAASGNYIAKIIQYTGITVNYVPGSMSLTFTNRLLTSKTASWLC